MIICYFLPMILFLGIITSYEDIKFGKIRNRWVLSAIAFAFAAHLFLFLSEQISTNEIFLAITNFFIAIAFSFFLWNFKFWSAGDAKLFIGYCALIPAGLYLMPFMNFFPSFNLFVNTIVLFFIYLVAKNIFVVPKKNVKKTLIKHAKDFPEVLISIFSVSWLARFIGGEFNVESFFYSFVLYAAIYAIINLLITKTLSSLRIKKIKPIHIYLFLIVLRVIFDFKGILNISFILSIIISAVLYSFLLRTIYNLVSETVVKNIPVLKLKEGDIICNKDEKGGFSMPQAEGLTASEVKKIKAFCRKRKIKTIAVAETSPFAPAMFAGVIITIVFGNIANLIYLFSHIFQMLWGLF